MARKKVKIKRIANEAKRRATLQKRRGELMTKARELATLCDIKACLVVYSPDEAQPKVWPSMPEGIGALSHFKSMPEIKQSKNMMNREDFLRQTIVELQDQLHKAEHDNREMETEMLMHDVMIGRRPGLVGLTTEELTDLSRMVELRLNAVEERIKHLQAQVATTMLMQPVSLLTKTHAGNMNMKDAIGGTRGGAKLVHGGGQCFSNGFGDANGSNVGGK